MYQRKPEEYGPEHRRDLMLHSEMEDWELNPDIHGWKIEDRNNDTIGKVDDLLISPEDNEALYAVTSIGGTLGIGGKKKLVPLDQVDMDENQKRLIFHGSAKDIENSPDFDKDTRDYGRFYDYYSRGGVTETRERERTEAREHVIPEVEEHLEARKHEEQVGEARIYKEVETHPETVREPVKKTRIRVIRRAPGETTAAGRAETLREGETIEIPIVEERLTAEKKAEVTEEVVIRPEIVEEEEEITEEVRKERVRMEGDADLEEEEEERERTRRTPDF